MHTLRIDVMATSIPVKPLNELTKRLTYVQVPSKMRRAGKTLVNQAQGPTLAHRRSIIGIVIVYARMGMEPGVHAQMPVVMAECMHVHPLFGAQQTKFAIAGIRSVG